MTETVKKESITRLAQSGLIAKGIVYLLIGFIAFTAAIGLGKQDSKDVSHDAAFTSIENLPGGPVLLFILAAGLLSYSVWRMVQVFRKDDTGHVKPVKRFRYFFSGLAYLLLTFSLVKFALDQKSNEGDQNQQMAGELMSKPFGPWLVVVAGLIFAAVGIYQVFYGLSEKYRKQLQSMNLHSSASSLLLRFGKVGYVARGVVWLVISYMLIRAGLHHNSSEAGNTDKAFQLLENSPLGIWLAAAVGLGLIAYGIFSFLRARYERFA